MPLVISSITKQYRWTEACHWKKRKEKKKHKLRRTDSKNGEILEPENPPQPQKVKSPLVQSHICRLVTENNIKLHTLSLHCCQCQGRRDLYRDPPPCYRCPGCQARYLLRLLVPAAGIVASAIICMISSMLCMGWSGSSNRLIMVFSTIRSVGRFLRNHSWFLISGIVILCCRQWN